MRNAYDLVRGCFAVDGARTPWFFQAAGLKQYLLSGPDGTLLLPDGTTSRSPSPAAIWKLSGVGPNTLRLASGVSKSFVRTQGCVAYPEAAPGATGTPFRSRGRRVKGFADIHFHPTADLRAGGRVLHGQTFSPLGIPVALGGDADDHGPEGALDVTGLLLRGGPVGTAGWPTFADWPTYDTNTHQQVYWTWLQRMYLAGLRLAVAQLVEDAPLCNIEPLKSHSCDEGDTIALEAQRMRALQDYVDAQSGGPGRGWLRLVTSSAQARRVIRSGRLAVLLGVESSNPFGCSQVAGVPQCDRDDVDRGMARFQALGIRTLFVEHWVDNAFGGAALEEGTKGTFISAMQVTSTGQPFTTGACPSPEQGASCNVKGLTDLGRYAVGKLFAAHIMIEADHLSEPAREEVLALADRAGVPVLSSHTDTGGLWTHANLRRLYAGGGLATATRDVTSKLPERILRFAADGAPAVPLGTDTGGFADLPAADPSVPKLTYPFRLNRVTFTRQVSGSRTFDLNTDGVAHYGLFADQLAQMRAQPRGVEAFNVLMHSAEAYLQTWARAEHPPGRVG